MNRGSLCEACRAAPVKPKLCYTIVNSVTPVPKGDDFHDGYFRTGAELSDEPRDARSWLTFSETGEEEALLKAAADLTANPVLGDPNPKSSRSQSKECMVGKALAPCPAVAAMAVN